MKKQVIRVAKRTYDALTDNDPNHYQFTSEYDTLKYYAVGDVVVTTDMSQYYTTQSSFFGTLYYNRTEVTVTHGLNYYPDYSGYIIDFPDVDEAIQAPLYSGDAGFESFYGVFADDTKLYFLSQFNSLSNSGTFSVHFGYRIFRNDLGF